MYSQIRAHRTPSSSITLPLIFSNSYHPYSRISIHCRWKERERTNQKLHTQMSRIADMHALRVDVERKKHVRKRKSVCWWSQFLLYQIKTRALSEKKANNRMLNSHIRLVCVFVLLLCLRLGPCWASVCVCVCLNASERVSWLQTAFMIHNELYCKVHTHEHSHSLTHTHRCSSHHIHSNWFDSLASFWLCESKRSIDARMLFIIVIAVASCGRKIREQSPTIHSNCGFPVRRFVQTLSAPWSV